MSESRRPRGSIAHDQGALLESAKGADVTLTVGDSQIPAHSFVLSARSAVFEAMLRHKMQEASSGRIDIPDVEEDVVRQLLSFMYTDAAPELDSMAADLLKAADKYDVPLLKEKCEGKLVEQLCVENAAEAAALAVVHSCPLLRTTAVRFIRDHIEVLGTDVWAEVLHSRPKVALEVCRLVAAAGAEKRMVSEEHKEDLRKRLYSAAENGRLGEVWALLAAGAEVDATDLWRQTALHRAASQGHDDVVKCLLDAGADPNCRNSSQRTPLHAAAENNRLNIVWLLVTARADVNAKDSKGRTPLSLVPVGGCGEMRKALLLSGAK